MVLPPVGQSFEKRHLLENSDDTTNFVLRFSSSALAGVLPPAAQSFAKCHLLNFDGFPKFLGAFQIASLFLEGPTF